jgi:hypothetical protein
LRLEGREEVARGVLFRISRFEVDGCEAEAVVGRAEQGRRLLRVRRVGVDDLGTDEAFVAAFVDARTDT